MRIDHRYTYLPSAPLPSAEDFEDEEPSTADLPVAEDDFLHFGREWPKISAETTPEQLFSLIQMRRDEIRAQRERFRLLADEENPIFQNEVQELLRTGHLEASKLGGGGVYFLCDELGRPQFVVKPLDEAILCLNNPKHRAAPFNDNSHRLRDFIPLYQTAPTEAAVHSLAEEWGVGCCTPETHLMVLSHELFYDIGIRFHAETIDREKLCSVQRFIPDSIDLAVAMHEWFEAGLESTNPLPLDQSDFEEILLLLWLIFDGDGHASNFRLYFKGFNPQGQASYGLKKVDNGLALPESNHYLLNYLGYLPNARIAPSQRFLDLVANIDAERSCDVLDHYHLTHAKGAFQERLEILKSLAKRPGISLEEINLRFELLCLPNGKELALRLDPVEALIDEATRRTNSSDDVQDFAPLRV